MRDTEEQASRFRRRCFRITFWRAILLLGFTILYRAGAAIPLLRVHGVIDVLFRQL